MKPTIRTDRLHLIPIHLNDLTWLHETFTHPFVRRYLWDDKIISLEKTQEILVANEYNFNTYSWGLWKIKVIEQDTYVGFTGLWFFYGESQPQILYGLLPQYNQLGYATEASNAIIDYAFNRLEFEYLLAACDRPNVASMKVCSRLGMTPVDEREIDGRPISFFRIDKINTGR